MKKRIASLLCVILMFSAFTACNNTTDPNETTAPAAVSVLKVGYSSIDITPKTSVPLAGGGGAGVSSTSRMSEEVLDSLYATCIAFSDETDNTILLFNLDILYAFDAKEALVLPFSAADISKETGIPVKQIMFTSTHNHHAPDLRVDHPDINDYNKALRGWLKTAALDALADRKPAKMFTATAYPEKQNFVRHYYMSDGSVAGSNFGDFKNNTIVDYVRKADNQMQLVKFAREGGKDVILMNWQGHPAAGGKATTYTIISNIRHMGSILEENLDCHFAFCLGASGNVNSTSRITADSDGADYIQRQEKLAQYAIDAAAGFEEVKIGKLQILGLEYEGTAKNGTDIKTMSLYAFSLGDVAFITAPYEMFCENGEKIKQDSPFKTTIVATCANGNRSYIPSIETYEYNAYEIGGCQFVSGTAELLVTEYTNMLNQLYETK